MHHSHIHVFYKDHILRMRFCIIRELSFFTGRGGRLFMGGPEFFGDQFFL